MRFSFAKTTTLALLGLGQVFLGANGAPTSLTQFGAARLYDNSVAVLSLAFKVGSGKGDYSQHGEWKDDGSKGETVTSGGVYPLEEVHDVFRHGSRYRIKRSIYDVYAEDLYVDKIGIQNDKDDRCIAVFEAWNKEDKAEGPDKEYLTDIMMALWNKREGHRTSDLNTIRFVTVTNTETKAAIKSAAYLMGKTENDGFTISSSAKEGTDEKSAFDVLLGSKFGQVSDRIRKDFLENKRISLFEISPGSIHNLVVKFE